MTSPLFFFFSFFATAVLGIPQHLETRSQCGSDGFQCDTGACIQSIQLCDGAQDCPDGSDETKSVCSRLSISCPSYSFQCAYGACIDKPLVCDGKQDCADGSDELLPQCRVNQTATAPASLPTLCKRYQFRCDSGQCIDDTSVCDGKADCRDASDESISQCVNFPCPVFSFQCTYGACIDKDLKCNGENNCHDGSDEDEEICPESQPDQPFNRPSKPLSSSTGRQCSLPDHPRRGNYEVANCKNCGLRPGNAVSTPATLIYNCPPNSTYENKDFGGPLRVQCSTDAETLLTSWGFPDHPLECVLMCKPLVHSSIVTTCQFEGKTISCEDRVPHGTIAKIYCQNSYEPPPGANSFAYCQDGVWDNTFRCSAVCGIIHHNTVVPAISYGENTSNLEYPWHAGIYMKNANTGKMDFICGGSIISPYVVLSAAHCFVVSGQRRNESLFRVAVGKTHRSWDINDPGQQVFLVRQYYVPRLFAGHGGKYSLDIAIVDLYKIITISSITMPVCLEVTKEYYSLSSSTVGYVVGWGTTETGNAADILQLGRLRYVDALDCRARAPYFDQYISEDKFCGQHLNGSLVGRGDSGGGWTYVHPSNKLYYLRGIVSIKPLDSLTQEFTAFTDVRAHKEFIEQTVNNIKRMHEKEAT